MKRKNIINLTLLIAVFAFALAILRNDPYYTEENLDNKKEKMHDTIKENSE